MIKVSRTPVRDLLVLEPAVFGDERGFFLESFNAGEVRQAAGIDYDFVQDNHSRSQKNVLRGLHYQIRQPQGKLVRVSHGRVFDVAVDLRANSATLGHWYGLELSDENHKQFWVPPGFAHGFLVLSEVADFQYKTTDYYAPEHERAIRWNDADLGIEWPIDAEPTVSAKDSDAGSFASAELFP